MPGYIKKALKYIKKQHQPYPSAIIKYGAKKQYATPQLTSLLSDKHGKKFIQQVCGKFFFWDKRSTAHCYVSIVQSHCKRQNQPKTQWNKRCNYSTTLQLRKKQSSHSAQLT
jgi:hypothetical protein